MATNLDKRRSDNPRLRLAALIATVCVLLSMGFAMGSSLTHTDVVRPMVVASPAPATIGLSIAASENVYISAADHRAALRRVIKSKQPLFCGGTKNYAALTFDDGPSKTSPELIALLRRASIPVTWFDLGRNAESLPSELKAQAAYGPVGNHSWDHTALTTLSLADFKAQLQDTQAVIKKHTGQDNRMMRPPYGARNPVSQKRTRKLGFAEILWSSDSQDGLAKSPAQIAQLARDGLGPGAIILFHDGTNPATLTALKKSVIPAIRRSGLTMVTIPDLLVLNPPGDARLKAGPSACSHAGRVNVSGLSQAQPVRY